MVMRNRTPMACTMTHNVAMNYDHAFHAGNHADVLKHLVLLAILDALARKPTSFFVLDTHAGQGEYALQSSKATATGEAALGVQQLARQYRKHDGLPTALTRYLDAVQPLLDAGRYPGSPALVASSMRDDDRLACCELQPAPATQLKTLFARDRRVGVHQRDGYAAVKALLPPREKRGLVLIDPPYEAQLAEFDLALAALRTGLTRWPQGIFALWYPIKQRRALAHFFRCAAALPARNALLVELMIHPDDSPLRLNGSGMLLLNAPWQIDLELGAALPRAAQALARESGSWRLEWLHRADG